MVLIYHEVFPMGGRVPHTSTQITVEDFERQMHFIAGACRVMDLPSFVTALSEGRLPRRACAITFDDGFADNAEVALPILQRYRLPAAFFLAAGYVAEGRPYEADALHDILHLAQDQEEVEVDLSAWGGPHLVLPYAGPGDRSASYFRVADVFKERVRWRDRPAVIEHLAERFGVERRQLGMPRMMTPEQVRALAEAGMTIGSHTEWHSSISADGREEFARQLDSSRKLLREMTGCDVEYFSYPFGDPHYCVPAWRLVRDAGYRAAFMACGLPARQEQSPWLIDRLATSGGLRGLLASVLGIKPSQKRQRRRVAALLAEDAEATST